MARLRACGPGAGLCGTPLGALSSRRPKQVRCANTSALVFPMEAIHWLAAESDQLEALSCALDSLDQLADEPMQTVLKG
eukprot:SM000093S24459  [mRNA]  locus=s93:517302:517538:- [translate_table: standard]